MSRQYVALSGLAMVLIVLHHSIDVYVGWLPAHGMELADGWQSLVLVVFHRLGKAAVPLFLFVSGSFIAYAARGNPPRLSWNTARSSILRLLWPYLLWSAVFYVLIFWQHNEVYSPFGYVKNLLVGYPFHFIPLLLFFYAISPLLAPVSRRYGLPLVLLVGLYQAVLISIEFPGTFGIYPPQWAEFLSPPVLGHTLALWAIYFPLGMVVSLNLTKAKPHLRRAIWFLIPFTLVFYLLDVLHTANFLDMPAAVHVYPLTVVLIAPLVNRNSIPRVKELEIVGKSTYGLYLTHLIVIDLSLMAIFAVLPALLSFPIPMVIVLFALASAIPLATMNFVATGRTRVAYRYVFG